MARSDPPTIRDIARLAGVSIATVSRVLNDRPDVGSATRREILKIIEEQQFQVNQSARDLVLGKTGVVAVTMPLVQGSYFGLMLGGIADALDDIGVTILLMPSGSDRSRQVPLNTRLIAGNAQGAVLMLPPEEHEDLIAVNQMMPVTVIDPRVPLDEDIPCVVATNEKGARVGTQHLLDLGHRRIGAVTGPVGWAATEERRKGFHAALSLAGVQLDPSLSVAGDWQIESGQIGAGRLLDRDDRPTAIFAFNDEMAIGTLLAARERGLRVPDDLSVLGFDDVDRAELVTPQLTTVRQPLAEMGRMAVSLLVRLIEQRPVDALRVELATRLIVRASTASPSR